MPLPFRILITTVAAIICAATLHVRADSLSLGIYPPEAQITVNMSTTYTITGSEAVFEAKSTSGLKYFPVNLITGTIKPLGTFDMVVYFKKFDGIHFSVDLNDSRNKLDVECDTTGNNPLFLSAKLLAFGWDPPSTPQFEFLWRKDGGSAEVLASSLPYIGAIVKPNNSVSTTTAAFSDFDHNFAYTQGEADVFLTPVPTAANSGMAIGLLMLGSRIRRRHSGK